ncbi:hypothetical protein [Corynebacterium phoceense]|uniref:hypothetical protein n=1 Tax=Corynebacterium phoceense TaxID=1686286 RepID=UPI00211B95C4|nr:hypothetical protein [Corynebacterium phoceense]MCQ9345117.1 hypothetical protein [Corynebacterium phoceense]
MLVLNLAVKKVTVASALSVVIFVGLGPVGKMVTIRVGICMPVTLACVSRTSVLVAGGGRKECTFAAQ